MGERPATAAEQRLAAIARARLADQGAREAARGDIWGEWFCKRVQLLDPLEPPGRQVAPYPHHFDYTRHLIGEWERHNQTLTWKGRRLVVSNSACAYFAGKAAHLENQRYYLIARVEGESPGEGARELIARTACILENLLLGPKINFVKHKLSIEFPDTGSMILGMGGNEPDKMRQVAANGVLCDEFGFWDQPEVAYQALRPTVEGRGKVILVCTTVDGFFKELVYDETDSWMTGVSHTKLKPDDTTDYVQYLDGFEAWTNPGNGFRVLKLYPRVDPRKQPGSAWEKAERQGMTDRAFRREHNLEFNVSSGRPVYLHEWNKRRMLIDDPRIEKGEPLICSLDFGYNRPAWTLHRLVEGKWQILRALQGHQIHLSPFVRQWKTLLQQWYPGHHEWEWVGDEAGNQEQQTDSPTPVQLLKLNFGITMRTTKIKDVEPVIDQIRDYMCTLVKGPKEPVPAFQVSNHPSTRIVVDALDGGYRYPEPKAGKPEAEKPLKDGFFDHSMNTLEFVAVNCLHSARRRLPINLAAMALRNVVAGRDLTV